MTPPRIKHTTFWLVVQCVNQLHHHVPQDISILKYNIYNAKHLQYTALGTDFQMSQHINILDFRQVTGGCLCLEKNFTTPLCRYHWSLIACWVRCKRLRPVRTLGMNRKPKSIVVWVLFVRCIKGFAFSVQPVECILTCAINKCTWINQIIHYCGLL